jgi:hypothetical protein
MADERVPGVAAPAPSQLRRGRVRVHCSDARADERSVVLGEGTDGWLLFAHELRFALDNTRFIDIGDTVYRCDIISRVEPINEPGTDHEPLYEALQACMSALIMIRDGGIEQPRELAAVLLGSLEGKGFVLDQHT